MQNRFPAHTERLGARNVVLIGAIGGMVAGMMMAMVEMFYGWVSATRTFWDAPMAIWAWVAGMDWFGEPVDHIGSIILGIGGHMMNSMMIGVVFVAMLAAFRARGFMVPVMAGVMFAFAVWAIMRYAILPLNAVEEELFTTDLVSPQWVWWISHLVLGMTAGMAYWIGTRLLARPGRAAAAPEMRRAA